MAKIEYNSPESQGLEVVDDTEARLRAEIESLKRRLEAQQHQQGTPDDHAPAPPSRRTLWLMALVLIILIVVGFVSGYIPHRRRVGHSGRGGRCRRAYALPPVTVVAVERSPANSTLVLPGNIQAVTESPVLARASGYIKRRYGDIGDRVKAGQLLAEIEAPELDQQVQQAQAAVDQVGAALEQATANLQQGKANEQLSKVTAQRWEKLVAKGAVSRQDNDTYQSQYAAQQANVQALEKAVLGGAQQYPRGQSQCLAAN